jgi:hypothetical protein
MHESALAQNKHFPAELMATDENENEKKRKRR